MNVFIVGKDWLCKEMFESNGYNEVEKITKADLVCFTGGADVGPSLYGELPHPTTYFNVSRDKEEQVVFETAKFCNIPMVGICRGGQFLNVMNGGKMYQNVNHHAIAGEHPLIDTETNKVYFVTSTHHQMMRPNLEDGKLVAFAEIATCKEYMDEATIVKESHPSSEDTEVVWYEKTKCLCFQPHPEFYYGETRDYFFELIARYIFNEE